MQYFSPDFLDFFKELAANNHKDWFDENRKRYEKNIKEPFKIFVGDLIETIRSEYEPDLLIEPKHAIYRINRDIRFAKDKTPYKTNLSALLSPKGRKNHAYASFYFELGPERIAIYVGSYGPNAQELETIRKYIHVNHNQFKKLLKNKSFSEHFPAGIQGDQHRRAPKEFKDFALEEPLILNKQFYYGADLNPDLVMSEDLKEIVLEHYKMALPMMNFFRSALGD